MHIQQCQTFIITVSIGFEYHKTDWSMTGNDLKKLDSVLSYISKTDNTVD